MYGLSDSFTMKHQILLWLVQWLNEQPDILQNISRCRCIPDPILSSADVVQRILDFVGA